jgi:hypothetical protein
VKVYDKNGVERDFAWAQRQYPGLTLLEAPDNVARFKLVAIYCTEAAATVKVEVRNDLGTAHIGQPVAFSWPSLHEPAPYLSSLLSGGLKRLWTERAVTQTTEGNGLTGFGISPDFYYKPGWAPGTVWVLSPSVDSDGLSGIGMLGGTVHEGPLHLVFQLTEAATQPAEPPPPTAPTVDLNDVVMALRQINQTLREAFRLRDSTIQ